jgi:hypothetical protein
LVDLRLFVIINRKSGSNRNEKSFLYLFAKNAIGHHRVDGRDHHRRGYSSRLQRNTQTDVGQDGPS